MNKEQLISFLLGELEKDYLSNSQSQEKQESGILHFNDKEIMKMPKKARTIFRIQGNSVHYRKRTSGRYNCSYELYLAKKPYNNPPIFASGTSIEEAKRNFIEKLNSYVPKSPTLSDIPKDFDGFAMYWFEKFHKRKVSDKTYDHDIKLYYRHIEKVFGKLTIKNITAAMLQDFLDAFSDRGKTAKDLYSIIKQILDCAVKHDLIRLNPLGMCILDRYDQQHGKALTYDEEKKLFATFKDTQWELPLAIICFTGLRPCEYSTAVLDGNFIKAQNSKRKNGKIEYKKIPISPMLRPYLVGISEFELPKPRVLNNRFKEVLPNHKLYDLRTTFQTRCTECGVAEVAIGLFMGNGIGGKLKEAYTDVSNDWLLKEAAKIIY